MVTMRQTIRRRAQLQPGFTLVEMLISVTLVLLMMTMFTAIFQMATSSLSTQRGIATMDQAARSVTTALRADIAKRSVTYAQPFYPAEFSATSITPFSVRQGYIYISTNREGGLDDVLQLSINANQIDEDTDQTEYFGASKLMYDLQADSLWNTSNRAIRRTTLRANPNQPDADDANLNANEVSSSYAGEVCYFVRNGGLYRRLMLLRHPLPVAGQELEIQPQSSAANTYLFTRTPAPSTPDFGGIFSYVDSPLSVNQADSSNGDHFFLGAGEAAPLAWQVKATNDLWAHFDFHAVPTFTTSTGSTPVTLPNGATFLGVDSLDNAAAFALGISGNRFGFNVVTGFSREHDNVSNVRFIGRFTHAETSDPDFNYPLAASRTSASAEVDVPLGSGQSLGGLNTGTLIGNGNPMDLTGTPLALNGNGVVSVFSGTSGRGGPRQVEDLLLTNVHSFEVEIWDARLQRFVTPSHSESAPLLSGGSTVGVTGDYHVSRNHNAGYGPHGPRVAAAIAAGNTAAAAAAAADNHVFDTSHPTGAAAPFVPYRYYPPRASDPVGVAGGTGFPVGPGPSPDTMTSPWEDYDPKTKVNHQNKGYWVPSDISDPMSPVENNYAVGDVIFVPFNDLNTDGIYDIGEHPLFGAFDIGYRCVIAGYSGAVPPPFATAPGQRFSEVPSGLLAGAPAVWVSFDNRQPLQAIRAKVQFFDPHTDKLRQLTLDLPLTTDR